MTSFFQHVKNGVRFAYVYHIAGMDWAATNDPDFAEWYNGQGVAAAAYSKLMFGVSAGLIQMLPILNGDLGAQTVTSTREGGIDVGAWSVTVSGDCSGYKFGKLFPYTAYTGWQSGLPGLNWSPDTTDPRIKMGVMSRDLRLDRSDVSDAGLEGLAPGTLYWKKKTDTGLKDYIDAQADINGGAYVWIGSSCLRCYMGVLADGADYYVNVRGGLLASPLEDLFYMNEMRYQITTVPLETAGRTSRLFAVPVDVTESLTPEGFGNEPFGLTGFGV